ncbi:tyrosine-type recombinase/integrase [Nodosilinea sp. LEGE 07298]|uniref:tyrosine-type recombinase/integrase n=1 Tax=Nodosilinea sp. LEGE 07298 TaxID=2777970 RepID=UPI0018822484|nr:tyrosine-type recombinase/integrase [Nodosilinea sp. LEGE 07298]MBE9111603.1 tyrosine-type recombinase/integrase [Nodosilinea sp. LEGE 07298]
MTYYVPTSLFDVLDLFAGSALVGLNPKLLSNLKTTLRKYVLPSHGFLVESLKKEIGFTLALKDVKIRDFQNAESRLLQSAIAAGVSGGTLANYKSALNRFLNWSRDQAWYHDAVGTYDGKLTPRMFVGYDLARERKGKRRQYSANPYGLRDEEFPPALENQLEKLHRFLTAPEIPKRKDRPLREATFQTYKNSIRYFFGWMHRFQDVPLEELRLEMMADRDYLDEFIAWGINDRGNGYGWATLIGAAALNITKWQHYKCSKLSKYRDIQEIEDIRALMLEIAHKREREPRRTTSKEMLDEKLVTFEQCVEVANYLRKCCAPQRTAFRRGQEKHHAGRKRSDVAVMLSWQRYLLVAILTYCPVRQRELRELELGTTLFREEEGYVVRLRPEDHKTGSKTGKDREFALPANLITDLDEWLNVWRPKIPTEHQRVFIHISRRTPHKVGQPYDGVKLSEIVTRAMYNTTGILYGEPKRTSPHDFRRIAITWQRKYGSRDQDEALAEMMGHSVREADRTYSQLTSRERTEKAKNWWKKV